MFLRRFAIYSLIVSSVLGNSGHVAIAQVKTGSVSGNSISSTSRSTESFRFGSVSPSLLSDDPRLSARQINGTEPNVYLSDLMKVWSAQTGIKFEALDNNKDSSGRWRVVIALHDKVSVAEVMDALRSVLSEKGATWQWQRSGKSPSYQYRLICPVAWSQHQEDQRKLAQAMFEEEFNVAKRGLGMTTEELNQEGRNDPTGTLNAMVSDPTLKDGLTAFTSSLTPEQQQSIIAGEIPELTLPVGALSEAGKSFADRAVGSVIVNSVPQKINPTKIVIKRSQPRGASTPVLAMLVGDDEYISGTGYVGGNRLENRSRELLTSNSMLNGDDRKSNKYAVAADQKILRPSVEKQRSKLLTEWLGMHGSYNMLSQLSEAASPRINFIACLPQSFGDQDPTTPYGQTLNELLAFLYKKSIVSKWNHDILLLRYTAGFAFHDGVENVASPTLIDFAVKHQEEWAKQKAVALTDLLQMAELGSAGQWKDLYGQYGTRFEAVGEVSDQHKLFVLMARMNPDVRAELLGSGGARIDTLPKELIRALNIPVGTPLSARVICGDELNNKYLAPNTKRIVWALVLEGDKNKPIPYVMASAKQTGILAYAVYRVPMPIE